MSTTKKPQYKGQRFTTPTGRASYPAVFKPKLKYQSETDYEYSIELLFPKGSGLKEFQKKCELAVAEVYGNDKKAWPKNISYPLTDQSILIEKADDKGQSTDHLSEGAMYARFKTNAKNGKPVIVDRDMNEMIDEAGIYGGCYVRVSGMIKVNPIKAKDPVTKKEVVTVWVTPYLSGVQFVKDGESFGSRASAADMFEPVAFEDDASTIDDLVG